MLLLVLWCDLMKNCPVTLNAYPGSSSPARGRSNQTHDSFQNVLLYVKESNRYLCINDRGRVYTRRRVSLGYDTKIPVQLALES